MKKNENSLMPYKIIIRQFLATKFDSYINKRGNLATNLFVAFMAFALISPISQNTFSQVKPEWGGYLQMRFFDDFKSNAGFCIRRVKLWIDGPAPLVQNIYYRVQGIFRYQTGGAFMLQDVYGEYKTPFGFFRAGQFVPDFALERQQPDALIPLIERATPVNVLIPAGDNNARDIGIEMVLEPEHSGFHSSLGFYNGNGGNTKSNEDRQFLYTTRTSYTIRFSNAVSWSNGFSIAYRNKKNLSFPGILGTGEMFSGKDFRWGIETHFKSDRWEIQGEYLETHLDNQKYYGYYIFGNYDIDKFNEIVLSTEKLHVNNPSYQAEPWYICGYTHFFNGQKFKLMIDLRKQNLIGHSNYGGTVQVQMFFK